GGGAVATEKLARAGAERVAPGEDRPPVEISLEILDERLDRRVAALRFAPQRGEQDRVEVAGELAGPPPAPPPRFGSLVAGVCRGEDGRRGRLDRLALDLRGQVAGAVTASSVRQASHDQLVGEHAERGDVGRRRDRLAADLLRRR